MNTARVLGGDEVHLARLQRPDVEEHRLVEMPPHHLATAFLPEGIELGENVDFGYVTVPEHHAHPEGPVIQIEAIGSSL